MRDMLKLIENTVNHLRECDLQSLQIRRYGESSLFDEILLDPFSLQIARAMIQRARWAESALARAAESARADSI